MTISFMRWYRSEEFYMDLPHTRYVYIRAHSAADALTCLKNSKYEVRSLTCVDAPPSEAYGNDDIQHMIFRGFARIG